MRDAAATLATKGRRRLVALGRRAYGIGAEAAAPAFWRHLWIRASGQLPFWFTDRNGVALRLYPEDNVRLILERGVFFDDEGLLALTRRLLRPGMTVLDVGAHYGQFGLFAAQLVGRDGAVHAFEPTRYSFERLRMNAARCGDRAAAIRLNRVAVGGRRGSATMYEFTPGLSSWNSLSAHVMYGPDGPVRPSASETVEVVTLDEYCAANAVDGVDLLKIDVEGFEADVLHGCARLIGERRVRHVVFEISLEPLKGSGRDAADVLAAVAAMGFDIERILADGRLERVVASDFRAPYFANYLATPVAA